MKLSTDTQILERAYGIEKTIEMLKTHGFDAADYSMFGLKSDDNHPVLSKDYEKYAQLLHRVADSCGIVFNQAHAPFPSYIDDNPEYSKKIIDKFRRCIEFAGLIGVEQICIHPITIRNDRQRELEKTLELYSKLQDAAKESGVKIALENMFWRDKTTDSIRPGACSGADEFIKIFDMLDDRYFTCLLDVGHCGLVGESADSFIYKMGERITALHVHDNDFLNDMHDLPFVGKMDWKKITKALHDINYRGDLTFEACCWLGRMPEDLLPDALDMMSAVGRKLIKMIENPEVD